jgi:hypothetical protein
MTFHEQTWQGDASEGAEQVPHALPHAPLGHTVPTCAQEAKQVQSTKLYP